MKIGILYSKYIKNTISRSLLKQILQEKPYIISEICSDNREELDNIAQLDVIINCLGKYYPEEYVGLFKRFYIEGGSIVHLGAEAFTIPYTIQAENMLEFPKTVCAIRSMGVIDDYYPCDLMNKQDYDNDNGSEHDKISYFRRKNCFSACYRLCEYSDNVRSRLDPLMVIKDKKGHPVFVPVMRVYDPEKGNQIYYQFNIEEKDWYQEAWLADSLKQVILAEDAKVSIDFINSQYARYLPEEKVILETRLQGKQQNSKPYEVTLKVWRVNNNSDEIEEIYAVTKEMMVNTRYEIPISCDKEGRYIAETSIVIKDELLESKRTGFYLLSDSSISRIMNNCGGIGINKKITDEFCVRKEEIFPIHGTTYFVTDVHRDCFENFNLNICKEDMWILKEDGFNVLRTGKWKNLDDFYQKDGNINLSGIRALQAFFISAAELGLMVQFVMGNVSFNHWDRESCAIHDPKMFDKARKAVYCFVNNFKEYLNVTIDILNEPSYSYQGAWQLARPSNSEYERKQFIKWLRTKYDNNLVLFRTAWNISSDEINSFDEINLPAEEAFSKSLYRTEQRNNHIMIADFFMFARESYHKWIQMITNIVRDCGPEMMVIMGRDESLRIPSEQDMIYDKDLDMVCWHQWNYNGAIFTEHLLNRVQGEVCCAQEIGIYQYDSIRGGKRYTEKEIGISLERKLIYSLGNWIQWQAFHDPYMSELSENSLGMFRADKTITPAWEICTKLLKKEESCKDYQYGGEVLHPQILTLYPASWYFGTNPDIIRYGMRVHTNVIYNQLKQNTVFVPDYAFGEQIKLVDTSPKLVILPCAQNMSDTTWDNLKQYVSDGGVLLIDGVIDQDIYFRERERIKEIDDCYVTEKLLDFERIKIGSEYYDLEFRHITGYGDVGNILSKGNLRSVSGSIYEINYGKGLIIYCPVPIELSDNDESVKRLYHYAIERAEIENPIFKVLQYKPNIFIYAQAYQRCCLYSVVNEGEADQISWIDLRSGAKVELILPARRSAKLWLDNSGIILDSYGEIKIEIKGGSRYGQDD
jgi:hypothetical protein